MGVLALIDCGCWCVPVRVCVWCVCGVCVVCVDGGVCVGGGCWVVRACGVWCVAVCVCGWWCVVVVVVAVGAARGRRQHPVAGRLGKTNRVGWQRYGIKSALRRKPQTTSQISFGRYGRMAVCLASRRWSTTSRVATTSFIAQAWPPWRRRCQ